MENLSEMGEENEFKKLAKTAMKKKRKENEMKNNRSMEALENFWVLVKR